MNWERWWWTRLFVLTKIQAPEAPKETPVEEEEETDEDQGILGEEMFGYKVSWPTRR